MESLLGEPKIDRFQPTMVEDNRFGRADFLYFSLITISFLAAVFIAGPSGNFPINDDLLYGYAVKTAVESGRMQILLSNAFDFIPLQIGTLLCSAIGFSYDALRGLTIAFHILGVLGLYLSLRELDLKRLDASILSTVYSFNPFLINLSCTCMTDVPSLALSNWIFYFALRGLKQRRLLYWVLAVLAMTAAMVTRQTAVCFAPALLLSGLISLTTKKDRLLFLSSMSIPLISFFAVQKWLLAHTLRTAAYERFSGGILRSLASILNPATAWISLGKIFTTLGFFLAPVTLPLLVHSTISSSKNKLAYSMAVASAAILAVAPLSYVLWIVGKEFMPFNQNLFSPPYIGTYQAIDAELIWPKPHLLRMGYYATAAAAVVCFALTFSAFKKNCWTGLVSDAPLTESKGVRGLLKQLCENKSAQTQLFLLSALVLSTVTIMVQLLTAGLDRYITVLIVPSLLLMAQVWKSQQGLAARVVCAAMSTAFLVYGTFCLIDHMNFNRALWTAARSVEASGVSPLRIEAGFEYDFAAGGIETIKGNDPKTRKWPESRRGGPVRSKLRWWPINGEDYIISCKPLDEFTIVGEVPYFNILRWRMRPVYILKSNELIQKQAQQKQ